MKSHRLRRAQATIALGRRLSNATMIWIFIVYGGRHVSKFDWNLNSALLLYIFLSSCKHGTVMFQFGYLPVLWLTVVYMTARIFRLILLTSVCSMNNYESCCELIAVVRHYNKRMLPLTKTQLDIRLTTRSRNIKASWHLLN